MRYTPRQYAAALVAALDDKTARERSDIAKRLADHIARAGMGRHLARILKETGRIMRQKEGIVSADIASASALTDAERRTVSRTLGSKAAITESVDPRLLAGIRILIDEETLIDATAARRLNILSHEPRHT